MCARVKKNIVTKGLSGALGSELVFRQRGDHTLVATSPTAPEGDGTEKQQAQRQRFEQAALYAKGQMEDASMKPLYDKKADKRNMQTAYNVAVADFLNAPSITNVDVNNYRGAIGDTIRITVVDDFMVSSVEVDITNQDGTRVERGAAAQVGKSSVWLFTATAENTSLAGDKITITATDKPGNAANQEKVMA